MQDITMPEGEALESLPAEDRQALEPDAGEQLTTGEQAQAFADHYILVHMNEASGDRTRTERTTDVPTGGASRHDTATVR